MAILEGAAVGRKKISLYGFGAAAAFVAMSSTAFACITYKGSMTIAGTGVGAVTGNKVTGDPTLSMTYCTGDGPTTAAKQGTGAGNTTVTTTVVPGVDCNGGGANHLAGTTSYAMKINNADGYDLIAGSWTIVTGQGCFSGVATNVLNLSPATKTTDANGGINGGASFSETLPATTYSNVNATPSDASVYCVGNSLLSDGIFAPFQVL